MRTWSEQPKRIGAVTLFVEDLAEARRFYQEVFELPVHFEDENSAVFQFGDTLINLFERRSGDRAHQSRHRRCPQRRCTGAVHGGGR